MALAETLSQGDHNSGSDAEGQRAARARAGMPLTGILANPLSAMPPPLMLLLAILSVQVGAALAINLFPALGPNGTAFWRIALSAIFLVIIARPTLRGVTRQKLMLLLIYGSAIGMMNMLFYQAIDRIPLGIAVTIEFLGPLGLAAATSRHWRHILWVVLAAGGVALLTPEIGGNLDPIGVACAALAGLCWAIFVFLSARVSSSFPGTQGLALGMVVSAVILAPLGAGSITALVADPWLILAVIGVAVLSTTIPFRLEFEALKRMPTRVYGILITLEPAAAVVIGALLLGQAIGLSAMLAVVCVTAAALGATLTKSS